MGSWLTRVITALVAILCGALAPAPAVATVSADATYTYDIHDLSAPTQHSATERGPPASYDHTTHLDAVDRRSIGVSARADRFTPRDAFAYDVPPVLAQDDSLTTLTWGHAGAADGHFLSRQLMHVAAEAGGLARPSAFVRTEALSGRASSRTVQELTESMRTNGWQGDPIKVVEINGQRIVVDGHHRLAAAQRAGINVPFKIVDPSSVIGPGQWSSVDDILRDAASVGPDRIR
jgi:hypothetical protein